MMKQFLQRGFSKHTRNLSPAIFLCFAVAGFMPTPGLAQPKGVAVPLKAGVYVQDGASCDTEESSKMLAITKTNINSSHVIGTIESASYVGNELFVIVMNKGDGGVGGSSKWKDTLRFVILGKDRAVIRTGSDSELFRWCRSMG